MVGGNWIPTLITMAGGENLFGEEGKHSPFIDWEEIRRADPDILFVSPCGFDSERTIKEMPHLAQLPGYENLRAVRMGRVFVADDNAFFNRPGPRIVESLEILAELFHPDLFTFGHKGKGWIRWDHTQP